MTQRLIIHVDMDAFYASVEIRDDPSLENRCVIIGGPERRGVVSTCNYHARKFGVHSAMPMTQALRLCPKAVVIAPRMSQYVQASKRIMAVFDEFSPMVEPLSLDEAFLDMTGTFGLFGDGRNIAESIKRRIIEETALTASVGVAGNKFLAKLASDLDKPDGITVIPFDHPAAAIAHLPIGRIWGVGKKSEAKLQAFGYQRIGDLAHVDGRYLAEQVGERMAQHLQRLSRGLDDRQVVRRRGAKSVGSETTLGRDAVGVPRLREVLHRQCDRACQNLRSKGLRAYGARLKIRWSRDFKLITRQTTCPEPFDDAKTLFELLLPLLARIDSTQPVRLVGAALFNLVNDQGLIDGPKLRATQLQLFEKPVAAKAQSNQSKLEHTLDAIREKLGPTISIGRTQSRERDKGQ